MKISNHKIIDIVEEELPELIYILEHDSSLFEKFKKDTISDNGLFYDPVDISCSYLGSELRHTNGTCVFCDYSRIEEEEEKQNLHFLDRTEWWDYCDYWNDKKKN